MRESDPGPLPVHVGPICEYECHEGSYAMPDILGEARSKKLIGRNRRLDFAEEPTGRLPCFAHNHRILCRCAANHKLANRSGGIVRVMRRATPWARAQHDERHDPTSAVEAIEKAGSAAIVRLILYDSILFGALLAMRSHSRR